MGTRVFAFSFDKPGSSMFVSNLFIVLSCVEKFEESSESFVTLSPYQKHLFLKFCTMDGIFHGSVHSLVY